MCLGVKCHYVGSLVLNGTEKSVYGRVQVCEPSG